MERAYLEIIFLCGMVLQVILLLPYLSDYFAKKYRNFFNKKERKYLALAVLGYLVIPFIYVFSTWFSWFDYTLSKWLGFPAVALYGFGFWLFYKAYVELGSSWSPGFDIHQGQRLITSGMYQWVRHPMYAAFLVAGVAQLFLLQNWVVGPASLVLSVPFYRYRVVREEQQLALHFGEEYVIYKKLTNPLIPKIDQIDFSGIKNTLTTIMSKKIKPILRKKQP